jgi:hypothetical protein
VGKRGKGEEAKRGEELGTIIIRFFSFSSCPDNSEAARDGRPTKTILMVGRASVPAIIMVCHEEAIGKDERHNFLFLWHLLNSPKLSNNYHGAHSAPFSFPFSP